MVLPPTSESAVRVSSDGAGAAEVERFLATQDRGTLYCSPAWLRLVEASYGHRARQWVAQGVGGAAAGAFAAVAVRHPLLGTKVVATPYQYYSGLPLGIDPTVRRDLTAQAIAWAREIGAQHLEIRHHEPAPMLEEMGFVCVESGLVRTAASLADLSLLQMRKGHREYVEYGPKRGLTVDAAPSLEELRTFYRMFLVEKRAMGSPQAGWRFFENLHGVPRLGYRLLLARHGGVCLGGLLTLADERLTYARYVAIDRQEGQRLHAIKALLWQAMQQAAADGSREFDFGISWQGDTGGIRFKEGWNGTTQPVYLYVHPLRSKPPAPGGYFEGFRVAKAVWRKLPLGVADWVGHQVTRWVC